VTAALLIVGGVVSFLGIRTAQASVSEPAAPATK
jgi:hypothetical protein